MDRITAAKKLARVARLLVGTTDTFECPECGTKVLENTGYCVKCEKKVKKSALGRVAMDVPDRVFRGVESAANYFSAKARLLKDLEQSLSRGNVGEAVTTLNRNDWMRSELPDFVISFLETAGKKLPVSESWKSRVWDDLEQILTEGQGADAMSLQEFLTYMEGTSNKFHYFAVFRYQKPDGTIAYAGGNAYGRIGQTAKVMVIARGPSDGSVTSAVLGKIREKERKGYQRE